MQVSISAALLESSLGINAQMRFRVLDKLSTRKDIGIGHNPAKSIDYDNYTCTRPRANARIRHTQSNILYFESRQCSFVLVLVRAPRYATERDVCWCMSIGASEQRGHTAHMIPCLAQRISGLAPCSPARSEWRRSDGSGCTGRRRRAKGRISEYLNQGRGGPSVMAVRCA